MLVPILPGRVGPSYVAGVAGRLDRRQSQPGNGTGPVLSQPQDNTAPTSPTNILVAAVAVVAVFAVIFLLYLTLRKLKRQNRSPRYLPGAFLKSKWHQWQPKTKYNSVNGSVRDGAPTHINTSYVPTEERVAASAAAAGVDRNTSVRSVMTLPAYSQTPKETEQVIGREGERANMDTVVEFPETTEEEEIARETEMSSLYQIRVARREEIAEREARRRERREARERGDWQRLEELRQESRARADPRSNADLSTGNVTADMLIAEHQSRGRERRVSSVAYASVGQVRHDGTRLRANSTESERGGLLDGAAPMGHERHGSDATSLFTMNNMSSQDIGGHGRSGSDSTSLFSMNNLSRPTLPFTGRYRSDSGALSISTMSSAAPSVHDQVTQVSSQPDHARALSDTQTSDPSTAAARYTPEESSASDDVADSRLVSTTGDSNPHTSLPPEYDVHDWGDAPAYEEQVRRAASMRAQNAQRSTSGAPQLPALNVPSINIEIASEPNTPTTGRGSLEQTDR